MTIFNTLSKATTTGLVALVLGTQPSQAIEPQAQSTYTQAQYESDLVYIQDQLDSKKTKQKTIPKSELMYTQKEFEKAFKKPRTNSTLLRKAELMHKNPKQTFNYLSKEQQKKVTRFCTSLQTSKDKLLIASYGESIVADAVFYTQGMN